MTTLKHLLLELRAIRLGQQLWLKVVTGRDIDLLTMAELDLNNSAIVPIAPRDEPRGKVFHKDNNKLRAKEMLDAAGDDTLRIIEYVRESMGDEAAEGLKKFYEDEILSKGGRI